MVTSIWQARSGRVTTRGLLVLLFLSVSAYYGVGALSAYFRFWRMEAEMRSQARQAPGLDDQVIRRRLVARAEALKLPEVSRRFVILRRTRPREIIITTSWPEPIELPFTTYIWTARPEARAPL
jgi:hypothetical protein